MRDLTDKIASIVTAIAALGAWVSSWFNRKKIRDIHVLMNSRLTELLKLTRESSFKEGEKAEKDKHERPR